MNLPVTVRIVAETGSTNADLLAEINQYQLTSPVLLIAESQTQGRGRAGRNWHSSPGASLTFSLAWKFRLTVQELAGLPLAVGVVLTETLQLFNVDAQLKWPNDVLKDGKKLGGILIETAAAGHAMEDEIWAVIGIGLNIAVPENLAGKIGQPVADAPVLQPDRTILIEALLNSLSEALALFEEKGFAAFMARWNALHAYAGQQVTILDHGQVLHEGVATGIDRAGRLLLDTIDGRIAVMVGDVSLRVAD